MVKKEYLDLVFHKNKFLEILKVIDEIEVLNEDVTQRKISIKSNTSYAHTFKILKKLEEMGFINVDKGKREYYFKTSNKWDSLKESKVKDIYLK